MKKCKILKACRPAEHVYGIRSVLASKEKPLTYDVRQV